MPLSLEIGILDVDTCESLNDVLVDIWVSRWIGKMLFIVS